MSFQHNAFQHDAVQIGEAGGAVSDPVCRAPVQTRIPGFRPVALSFVAVNLLLTTLAVPFTPARASLVPPVTKRTVQTPLTIPSLLTSTLAPVSVPFAHDDWPNPVRLAARPQVDVPTVFDRTPPVLPFGQSDWQNPSRLKKVAHPYPHRPTVDPATAASDPPFTQTHWPNPVRKNLRQSVVGVPPFEREEVTAVPFSQESWPNPVRLRRVVQTDIPPVFDRSVAPVAPPFAQTQWPNPVRKAVKQSVVGVPPFGREPAAPFTQSQWPNPVRKSRTVQTDLPQAVTREPIAVPFTQHAWPNPVRRVLPREWGATVPVLYSEFVFVPPMPNNVSDWPNPVLRVLPSEWGSQAPLQYAEFIIVPPKPYNIADWPNPTRPILPREWGGTAPINYDGFVSTPLPPEPEPEIIIGGDDAPRKRPKTKKERRDLFREIEQTVHRLLFENSEESAAAPASVVVHAPALNAKLETLRTLAEGQQNLLQRTAALEAKIAAMEEQHRLDLERDEEDAMMWLF